MRRFINLCISEWERQPPMESCRTAGPSGKFGLRAGKGTTANYILLIPDIYMSSFKKKIVFFRCSQNTMKQLLFWTKKLMPYRIISGKLFTNVYIMQTMQQILFNNSEYDSIKSSSFHRFYTIFSFCKFKRQQMAIIVASCDPFRQRF